MFRIIRVALVFFGLISSSAYAATTTTNVNCRSAPKANARIVMRIPAGTYVDVRRRSGAWAFVERRAEACWINSQFLGEESAAEANRVSLRETRQEAKKATMHSGRASRAQRRSPISTRQRSYRMSHRARRSSGARSYNSGGGSCPCSGGNICIGPRGGRYCITSGGNKRYGV